MFWTCFGNENNKASHFKNTSPWLKNSSFGVMGGMVGSAASPQNSHSRLTPCAQARSPPSLPLYVHWGKRPPRQLRSGGAATPKAPQRLWALGSHMDHGPSPAKPVSRRCQEEAGQFLHRIGRQIPHLTSEDMRGLVRTRVWLNHMPAHLQSCCGWSSPCFWDWPCWKH